MKLLPPSSVPKGNPRKQPGRNRQQQAEMLLITRHHIPEDITLQD
jgi:hypothetical protein